MMKKLILILSFTVCAFELISQVSVNNDSSNADASAMFDVKSTTKGFLPPRMTTEQMNGVVTPAEGLLVYNTTVNALYWFNGTTWKKFNEFNFTESDPVFLSHPSFGISNTQINNWNYAYTNRITAAVGAAPLSLSIVSNQINGSMTAAGSSSSGYLTSADWNSFNIKVSSQWVSNGTKIYYNTDNVGIGTTNPQSKIDIAGNAAIGTGYSGSAVAPSNGLVVEGQSGFGTATPAPSAIVEMNSTSRGLLPPRMTTAQRTAIASPAPGLTIFNTDLNCIEFYQAGANSWYCPCLSSFTIGCSTVVVNGTYVKETPLNASNTVTLVVSVTSPGGYSIRTKTVNGCTFSASGTFTGTGFETVTLHGSGIPVDFGEMSFILLSSNNETNCSFLVPFFSGSATTMTAGNDIFALTFPYTTYWEDSKSQMLYKATEFQGLGFSSGLITSIGFKVSQTFSMQYMNGFQISLKNTSTTDLTGGWETGLTTVYSGIYAVPGPGWGFIPLQTPFIWNGSNILVEICFDNSSYTANTNVEGSEIPNGSLYQFADGSSGCSLGNPISFSYRPNISIIINPPPPVSCGTLVVDHFAGSVAPVNKTVTYSTVTNIPGESSKCWITKNLGATQRATSVSDATEASAGWYWQFNRKQGYKHDGITRTPNTTWISSINENSNWLASNDPCTLELGTGWRLPTQTEWYNVDNTGGWTNWNGPWNSGLKLHAAGHLIYSNGALYSRGSGGSYWSSTQYSTIYGWHLYFTSGYSYMHDIDTFKAYGFSVRCLRDN